MLYHILVHICLTLPGSPQYCQPDKLIDTTYFSLVRCYSGASVVEKMTLESGRKVAKEHHAETTDIQVKTQCITSEESEEFLKKAGADGLMITGKKYE